MKTDLDMQSLAREIGLSPSYRITQHAYQRAKQRLGWKASVLEKMVVRIYRQGIQLRDTKGALRKYCVSKRRKRKKIEIRIYGEHIYLFEKYTLVTLYRVENHLLKYLKLHAIRKNDKRNNVL